MLLRNKTLIIAILSSLLFIVCSYFALNYNLYTFFIPIAIGFGLMIGYLINAFLIKPIHSLITETANITKHTNYDKRLQASGNDETNLLAVYINELLDALENGQKEINKLQIELNARQNQSHLANKSDNQTKPMSASIPLQKIIHYDKNTALPNRVFFNEILNKSINHAKRHQKMLAILIIAIDSLPETVKSTEKNTALIFNEIGKRLANSLRQEDIIAKSEGDEFYILLNDIGKAKYVSKVAEKLLTVCSYPVKILDPNTYEFSPTTSIGICIYPNDGESLEELLENADNALYEAKQAGGNHYRFYAAEMGIEAREYLQLESSLRKALHNNELAVYYQPKLNIKKANIIGVEALIRWEHPVIGVISPTKFIDLAEESGLIMDIGKMVLKEACQAAKYWHDEGYQHISVSVNLSPQQFYHPNIVSTIQDILKKTNLHPSYLELEITEKVVMDDLMIAEDILEKLKAIGVQISIDHFGTGYTSISHLKRLPINAIKIDQNFIKGIPYNPNDSAITCAIIALAHNLGLEVVAENVETADQVQFLATQNCDMIQGYFLSQPLPAEKVKLQFTKLRDEVMI